MDKPTQGSDVSRYGRKRKLTDDYQAATSTSKNAKSPEVELGRTRKATKAKVDSSIEVLEVPTVKNIIHKKSRRPARKFSKKRRGVPKKKAKIEDEQENQDDEEPEEDVTEDKGNEEFISQQLLKISMDEQQPEQILIDLGNYMPVKQYGKIVYKAPKPENDLVKPDPE
jgi:hypothetical protein